MEIMRQPIDPLRSNCNYISRHRPYRNSSGAFEISVIYIRVVSPSDMQNTMKIIFPSRDVKSSLQINGMKINPFEKISRTLRRQRTDALMSETIYVNTERMKFNGPSLPFEVQMQGSSVLLSGILRRDGDGCMLLMECKDGGTTEFDGGLVDLYFAGRSLGRPVLVNGVVEMKKRWRGLGCIPEEGDEAINDNSKESKQKVIAEDEEGYSIPMQKERWFLDRESALDAWWWMHATTCSDDWRRSWLRSCSTARESWSSDAKKSAFPVVLSGRK